MTTIKTLKILEFIDENNETITFSEMISGGFTLESTEEFIFSDEKDVRYFVEEINKLLPSTKSIEELLYENVPLQEGKGV